MLHTLPDPDRRFAEARRTLEARGEDLAFDAEPALATEIAALGLWSEIGTPNDQISPQLVCAATGSPVPAACARADLVDYRGHIGVRIRYVGHDRLVSLKPELAALFHPALSCNADGTLHQVVVFPTTVARFASRVAAQLVIVPSWALDMPFGDSTSEYYRDFGRPEKWSGVRHWITHFCELTEARQIPFFTSHDLVAHIAGFQAASWTLLVAVARRLRVCIEDVFGDSPAPPLQSLVLPFMAGYLLDGLAQPVHGDSERIVIVIDELLAAIAEPAFAADDPAILRRFPQCYWHVLEHMRTSPSPPTASFPAEIRALIHDVVGEIRRELASDDTVAGHGAVA